MNTGTLSISKKSSTRITTWSEYESLYHASLSHPDEFWDEVAREKISWKKTWSQVSRWNYHQGKVEWYSGSELNVAENCLDRHIQNGKGSDRALIWVGNEPDQERVFTYTELYEEVCRVAHALEAMGIKKGDRIGIYLPNIPELAFAMLACARIGAIHSVIFGGFSAQSIQSRMNDCQARLILTCDGTYRGSKWIDLKSPVDEALRLGCPSVQNVIVLTRKPHLQRMKQAHDIEWSEWIQPFSAHQAPSHSATDPLFILYTSGSTGTPKGVLHSMGGYLTYVAYTHELVFQPQPSDVYWCTADLGWITGHSYLLYGPLANGITTLMYEGVPNYPNSSRFWEIVDRYQVNLFYTAPTAIRILAAEGSAPVQSTSRKSLRTLGTVGEPIQPEAWKWYSSVVGEDRCPIVDTWWQTETGGILISALSGITPLKAGSATLPLPGIEPRLLDENGEEITGSGLGSLVIARSWPGQMIGVYGDPNRFYETYFKQFPGYYCTGDGARRDEDQYYWILGRTDDVIKVSGHRIGTAEIEAACLTHPQVIESAACGIADPITGEALCVFIVLKPGVTPDSHLKEAISQIIRREVGAVAKPQRVEWIPGLPKTRSGKIMRRILKKIAVNEFSALGDLTTLADPQIVQLIINQIQKGSPSEPNQETNP